MLISAGRRSRRMFRGVGLIGTQRSISPRSFLGWFVGGLFLVANEVRGDEFGPGAYSYTVPAGVTQLRVQVAGGHGGRGGDDSSPGGASGKGALITTILNVTPGQTITGTVGAGGENGGRSSANSPYIPAGGAGAGNGGNGGDAGRTGSSGRGGGGGGGSSLAINGTTVLKAGGGGGGQGGSRYGTGLAGGNASAAVSAANCNISANGGAGASYTGSDGAGGGGGGGGYTPGGSGGTGHSDGGPGGTASTGAGSCYSNSSTLFAGTPVSSTNPRNNPFSVTHGFVIIEAALELTITKTNGTTQVLSGGQTTYTIRVTNNGPSAATGIVLSDPAVATLPKSSVACSASPGECVTPPTIAELESGSFGLPTLAVGEFYEIQVTASVQSNTTSTVANAAWTQPPSGFFSSGNSCTNTGLPSGVTRTFTASNSRCTVTDTDSVTRANVTLKAATRAQSGVNQNFSVTPSNMTVATAATINAGTATAVTRDITNAGAATTLSQAAVAGWAGGGIACVATSGNNGQVNGAVVYSNSIAGSVNSTYSATIPANTFIAGNSYECTITNDRVRLRYQKTTLPEPVDQDFTVQAFNGRASTVINATTNDAAAYAPVTTPQNTANLTETGVAGWTPQSLVCVADTGNNGVTAGGTVLSRTTPGTSGGTYTTSVPGGTFVPGNDYTCTWTNSGTTVTIVRKTAPIDGIDFPATVNVSNFTDNSAAVINAGTGTTVTRVLANPAANTMLNQQASPGWRPFNATCRLGGTVVYENTTLGLWAGAYNSTIPANTFTSGNNYVCTITSQTLPVRLAKATVPAGLDQSFTANLANPDVTASRTINAAGGPSAYIPQVSAGDTTTLSENGVANWRATGLVCKRDSDGATVYIASNAGTAGATYTASPAVPGGTFFAGPTPGNSYTCTFSNEPTAPLLTKAFGAAEISVGGTNTLTFTISNTSGLPGQMNLSFTDVLPSGLSPASTPVASQCGGSVSVTGNTISFSGGSLEEGQDSCTIAVDVTTAAGQGEASCPNPSTTNGRSNIQSTSSNLINGVTDQCLSVVVPSVTLQIAKVTQGSAGTFTFNGTAANHNGFPTDNSYTVTTTTPDIRVEGAQIALTNTGVATSVAETLPEGWILGSARCEDLNAAATGNPRGQQIGSVTDGRTLVIPAQNVREGAELFCTFTNSYAGFSMFGRVFVDNGMDSGTVHNAIADGSEGGLGGVTVWFTDCGSITYASTATAADGSFVLPMAGPAPFTSACIVRSPVAGFTGVSGKLIDTDSPAAPPLYEVIEFPYSNDVNYDFAAFGIVANPVLGVDGSGTGAPGAVVLLNHQYVATTSASVAFSLTNRTGAPDVSGFVSTLHRDTDCSGTLEPAEAASVLSSVNVVAGDRVCIVVRTQISTGAAQGSTYNYDIRADTTLSSTQADAIVLWNADMITISADGTITLTKRVRNVSAGGQPVVNSTASPGDVLEYIITFENPSAGMVSNLTVIDEVPAYTSLLVPPGATVTDVPDEMLCEVVIPSGPGASGYVGPIQWECTGTLNPGDAGQVAFQVRIDE